MFENEHTTYSVPCKATIFPVQVDKFNNRRWAVHVEDKQYTAVHNPSSRTTSGFMREKFTIFKEHRDSIRVELYEPVSDTQEATLSIGPYHFSWGDGELLSCKSDIPPTSAAWSLVRQMDYVGIFIRCMADLADKPVWQTREEREAYRNSFSKVRA